MTGPAGYGTPSTSTHSAGKHSDARRRPLLRTMVGDVLRRTRLEQGRTLADVARAARVSMAYLSEIERGRKEASSEILAAICDALRVDLADLLAMVGASLAAPTRIGLASFGFSPSLPPAAPDAGRGSDAQCRAA